MRGEIEKLCLGATGCLTGEIMMLEAHRLPTLGSTPFDRDANLLRLWIVQVFVGSLIFTGAAQLHGVAECARRVARFLLKGFVLVQRLMRSRVRFHIAEIAIHFRGSAGLNKRHVGEPVRNRTAQGFGARAVAVDDDPK
jgi:hypothetical protein